jgi:aminomethyltransferase
MAAGGARPPIVIGSAALDLARIEAGFIQVNAEFISATRTLRVSQTRSPYELGLDWTVNLGKDHFVGKRALAAETARGGPRRRLVGLDIAGKKPAVESFLYAGKTEVGRTTSATWSPVLKRNIALASVASAYAADGIELQADIWHNKELKIERIMAPCRVVSRRFYDASRRCT